ncbi:uncharacterized protein LOC144129051 [Amblyomma americanum]
MQRLSRLEQARQEPRTRSPSPPVSSLPPQCPQLPAFTFEDFEAAEAAVRDDRVAAALRWATANFSFQKQQLLRLGGNNLKEVAANVMSAVMGVAVQRLFSLRGRKGKRPFVGTKLCRVATGIPDFELLNHELGFPYACRKCIVLKVAFLGLNAHSPCTDAICERQGVDILAAQGFISRWLPGVCDREGGRKRRYAQALEHPESQAPSEEPQASPVNPCAGSAHCPGAPSASCPAAPPGMAVMCPSGVHPSSAPSPAPPPPPQPPPHA